jgi:ubiquinone/menaquinone biosynthesis C-methylase UbiE
MVFTAQGSIHGYPVFEGAGVLNPDEYRKMYELENSYWWFQGRRAIISGLLRRNMLAGGRRWRILDVGCGTGLMLEHLKDLGQEPAGLDLHSLSMFYCKRRGIKKLIRGDVTALPFPDNSFDLILALDLIEHVEDDRGLLREFHRVCAPGGKVMITAPAHPFLWSDHDEALHHFRRYRHRPFLSLLREAGFHPIRYSYAITLVYAPIVAFRVLQRLVKRRGKPKTHLIELPQWINQALIGILRLEGALLERMNLPFGVSLLALLERQQEAAPQTKDCVTPGLRGKESCA